MYLLDILLPFAKLMVFCAVAAIVLIAVLIPISKRKTATYAVLKRNFAAYFSNPTGYVFICVFMLLSSIAAFWPDEFFSRNLATLDQLNQWFPLIMMVFIPAITMSIWSEERYEGTDELLLTIPASDIDIVLGKYLAAVSIFTAALWFSMVTNFLVLISLSVGEVDVGLFIATYIGYWFIGLSMLALGMAASFLTSNLTIGFLLGALFNAPLVFLLFANRLVASRVWAQGLSWWSYSARFADFGRGVISLSGIIFFTMVAAIGVYLSILLIGRRHWAGGRDGQSMFWHYLVRAMALVGIAVGVTKFLSYNDLVRYDATSAKVSSLSPDTLKIIEGIQTDNGVLIEAFISGEVPQAYVEKKVDLINALRELEARGGNKVQVRLFDDLEPFTEQATRAEEQYGITPQEVNLRTRGGLRQEEIFMGAALSCGLERVVIPFFDLGIPVEYELIRSVSTVAGERRRKIGVLKTDAGLFGGFNPMMGRSPKQLIVTELEKQFEVEEVDPSQPIPARTYDVLVAVQPSSLTPPQLENLVATIREGQPTAIFEDPFPYLFRSTPGTSQPKRPQGGMFGMGGQPPEPKGEIRRLWDTLGIEMVTGQPVNGFSGQPEANVIWQNYNPYANLVQHRQITPEWVFASPASPGADRESINVDEPVTSGLEQLLFLCPGAIRNLGARDLEFTTLVKTGDQTGTITPTDLQPNLGRPESLRFVRALTEKKYVIAARIRGILRDDLTMSDAGSPLIAQSVASPPSQPPPRNVIQNAEEAKMLREAPLVDDAGSSDTSNDSRNPEIHVVYVSDIDLLSTEFIALRAQPEPEIPWDFDNVPFVLNIIDSLADDSSLLEIRKRKMRHSTLKLVDYKTDDAQRIKIEREEEFEAEFQKAREAAEKERDRITNEFQEAVRQAEEAGTGLTPELQSTLAKMKIASDRSQRIFDVEVERLEREKMQKIRRIENDLEMDVRKVQNNYKVQAAFLPLIPPFIVGLIVFWIRSARERESVGTTRVR